MERFVGVFLFIFRIMRTLLYTLQRRTTINQSNPDSKQEQISLLLGR